MKKRIIASLLCAAMVLTSVGCGNKSGGSESGDKSNTGSKNDTLVIGISEYNGVFNPLYYTSAYDSYIIETMFTSICGLNDNNEVVPAGGELTAEEVTAEDGTIQTLYTVKLKEGMKFHDGEDVNIDDVLFTYYAFLDPTYDGMSTFRTSVDIVGANEYYYDDAEYSSKVAAIGEEGAAKAATKEGFLEYLVKSNCENWYAGDPNGDAGGVTFVEYLTGEGYDAASVSGDSAKFLDMLALCEYEKYADAYDATTWWTAELSKAYISEGLADGIDVPEVEGIKRVDDYTCTILTNGVNISGDKNIGLQSILPEHYYGADFEKGNLETSRTKNDSPMGSGPFKWVAGANNVVSLEKFDDYYQGTPKINNLKFQVVNDEQKINAIISGDIDITDPSASLEAIEELQAEEIPYSLVGNPGYGYIAISAKRIPDQKVREGLMHLMTREQAINTYYGELAQVIERPMTPTLAEYPADAEEFWGYDKEKALECFKSAGYEQVDGKLVKDGKQLSVEVVIGEASTHPSTPILTQMKNDLEELGGELVISDVNTTILFDRMNSDDVDMWVAAWGNALDCDLSQMFGSEYTKAGGSNRTWVQDPKVDALQAEILKTLDLEARKELVAEELDKIMGWATYMPIYQRKNLFIYNPDTVNIDTIPENTSTYYDYSDELHLLELN